MKTIFTMKRFLCCCLFVPGLMHAYSQRQVTGTVRDASGPLVGVTVLVKDASTMTGTTTDMEGRYAVQVPDDSSVIEYSYVGYASVTEKVGVRSVIDVLLQEDKMVLDEVVVVGFGTQKKVNLTGAVSEAKMDEVLGDRPVASLSAVLQGAIPGLNVSGGLGPDANMSLNIRGFTSTTGGSPLVLIDNVQASLDMINPQDIESVSVLKDAAAASIYGARASYGVVLITTKKGQRNQPVRVNYNNNFGFSMPTRLPRLAGNIDYLNVWMDYKGSNNYSTQNQDIHRWIEFIELYNSNPNEPLFADMYPSGAWKDPQSSAKQPVYFYLKPVFQPGDIYTTGFSQTHNVSMSGGAEKINYRLSAGYYDNNGIIIDNKEQYDRFNVSSYINTTVTKWLTQSVDIRFSTSTLTSPNNNNLNFKRLYGSASNICPAGDIPTYDAQGNVTLLPNAENALSRLAHSTPDVTKKIYPRIFSSTKLTPFKGFEVNFEYTYNFTGTENTSYEKPTLYGRTQGASTMQEPLESSYYQKINKRSYHAINAYASYSLDLGKNHLAVLGGYNQEWERTTWTEMTAWGLVNTDKPSFSTSTGIAPDGSTHAPVVNDSYAEFAVVGLFFRMNYDYDGRYLIELNGRYDGSSKFPRTNRFGFFPSVSVGWNIGKEAFLREAKSLDLLKLRFSYGSIGNQNVGNYGYYSTVTMDTGYDTKTNWYDVNSKMYPYTIKNSPNLIRSNYTWEEVTTADLGVDFAFFGNRLYGSGDIYQRTTSGMLSPGMQLPSVIGASSPTQNAATAVTKGWEFAIGWRDTIGAFSYDLSFNISDSRAEITKFNNPSKLYSSHYEGEVIGEIWGYVTDGYYTADDFIDPSNPAAGLRPGVVGFKGNSNIRPGDIKYKQLDNAERNPNFVEGEISDGDQSALNPGDKKIIGYDVDRYNFGLRGSVGYKGLNLSFLLQGVGKHDVWLPNMFPFQSGEGLRNDQLDYWKPVDMSQGNYAAVNPHAEYPRLYGGGNSMNYEVQTKYLASAAYLRVKNLTLSYDIPKRFLKAVRMQSLKVFVSCENPFTITDLPAGYDPENISLDSIYQVFKTYSFGVNITF